MSSPFRKKSLERLSSPEQLDQMLQVTSPGTWMGFTSIAVFLMAVLLWSIYGNIPQKINGIGTFFPAGDFRKFSLQQATSPARGLVLDILVKVDDELQANQQIVQIKPFDSDQQKNKIQSLQNQLNDMEKENAILVELENKSKIQSENQKNRETQSMQTLISSKQQHFSRFQVLVENKERLSQGGVISEEDVLESENELSAIKVELNAYHHQLTELEINYENLLIQQERLQSQRSFQIAQLKRQITVSQSNLDDRSNVKVALRGTVLQVNVARGSEVALGQNLLLLDQQLGDNLKVQGYVSVLTGKQITPGMEVQVSPSIVKREEFGYLKGVVTQVSDYPEGRQSIEAIFDNELLVEAIIQQTEIPLKVEIDLLPGENQQQYFWSTGKEPPQKLSVGTVANFSVITHSKKPIELVIPYISKMFGLD